MFFRYKKQNVCLSIMHIMHILVYINILIKIAILFMIGKAILTEVFLDHSLFHLFMWCIFMSKIELAKTIWRKTTVQLLFQF